MARILSCLVVLLFSSAIGNAQVVGNCNCACKQGTQKCVPSFQDQCPDTCSISACGANQVDTLKSKWSAGACQIPTHQGDFESLRIHIQWSIGHQGARVRTGPHSDELKKGETLRAALVPPAKNSDVQHYASVKQAVYELEHAGVEDLERATENAIGYCTMHFPEDTAFQHLKWAADFRPQGAQDHDRYKYEMDRCHKGKDYDCIRRLFSQAQSHDDNLRNQLYCYSGSQIDHLMSRLGPIGDPPPWEPREHPIH
jgi:hypothetical protein